jgi:hypothetical protein
MEMNDTSEPTQVATPKKPYEKLFFPARTGVRDHGAFVREDQHNTNQLRWTH